MPRRRRIRHAALPSGVGVEHFLVSGCYLAGDLESFTIGGDVMRGDLHGLRELWLTYGDDLRAITRSPFAARVLAGDSMRPEICQAHDWRNRDERHCDDESGQPSGPGRWPVQHQRGRTPGGAR